MYCDASMVDVWKGGSRCVARVYAIDPRYFARLQMRVFFSELLHRLPPVFLAGEPRRLTSNFINGLTHLPIRWG